MYHGFRSFLLIVWLEWEKIISGKRERKMNEREAYEFIECAGKYGIVPGLDSIRELCRRLGNPQEELKFVHIAGTNGKGSVSAYVSTVLTAGGYRVGRYISPVIFEYRERIQVGNRMITKKALCEGMERIRAVCEEMVAQGMPHPTPFEIETALGFLYFKEKKCDIVVLETGMGGLLDATNLIENTLVAVLVSISMDHMQYLGNSLAEIAANKAGIIKKGCMVVSAKQQEEVAEVILKKAREVQCENVRFVEPALIKNIRYGLEKQRFDYGKRKKMEISLAGEYQIDNGALALEVLDALGQMGFEVKEQALRRGMLETRWPGRFTLLGKKPIFVVDGAHNEDAAKRLAKSIEFYFTNKKIIYIMGVLRDKEYGKIIDLTHSLAEQIITVRTPDNPRAMSAYELAQEVAKVHPNVTAADSLEEAVELSHLLAGRDDVIVAFGSLSFLGKLMQIYEKRMGQR